MATPLPAARHVAVAVDGSDASKMAVLWAARNVLKTDEDLHLVMAVTVPVLSSKSRLGPSPVAVENVWESAGAVLLDAAALAGEAGAHVRSIQTRMLPVSEAASSPGAVIVTFATTGSFKLVVLGNRGMGAVQRGEISTGIGSVCSYVVQHATLPVAVVRQVGQPQDSLPKRPKSRRRVCVAVDGSPAAEAALEWTLHHLLDPARDVLHLLAVAVPTLFPVAGEFASTSALVGTYLEQKRSRLQTAEETASAARTIAIKRRMPWDQIVRVTLDPVDDSLGDVSSTLIRYTSSHQVDALVVGAHGMGAFKAGTSAAARIGSVSHACVEQAPCPVVVARFPPATAR